MKTSILVGRVTAEHPNGRYTIADCTFTTLPTAHEVTDEQRQQIEEDRYVLKAQYGSREWCEAQGIPFTEEELKKLGLDVHAQPLLKAAAETEAEAKPAPVQTKKQLIEELKAKGIVEGKDFHKDAKLADLQALLATL